MSPPIVLAFLSVIGTSCLSLIGLLMLRIEEERLNEWVFFLVSLSVGAMFGDAFIHLLPEAFARSESALLTSFYTLSGLLVFFLLEKVLRWRHQHLPHCDTCIEPVGYASLVADGIHNFVDGMVIGSGYLVSVPIGVATTLAVVLHEVPQEISDFALLIHAGFSRRRAIALNALCGSLGILGLVVCLAVGSQVETLANVMLPLTAGGFVYIAGCDLVPELHRESEWGKSLLQLLGAVLGVALMFLLAVVT